VPTPTPTYAGSLLFPRTRARALPTLLQALCIYIAIIHLFSDTYHSCYALLLPARLRLIAPQPQRIAEQQPYNACVQRAAVRFIEVRARAVASVSSKHAG
jgi:hypothetical protein